MQEVRSGPGSASGEGGAEVLVQMTKKNISPIYYQAKRWGDQGVAIIVKAVVTREASQGSNFQHQK